MNLADIIAGARKANVRTDREYIYIGKEKTPVDKNIYGVTLDSIKMHIVKNEPDETWVDHRAEDSFKIEEYFNDSVDSYYYCITATSFVTYIKSSMRMIKKQEARYSPTMMFTDDMVINHLIAAYNPGNGAKEFGSLRTSASNTLFVYSNAGDIDHVEVCYGEKSIMFPWKEDKALLPEFAGAVMYLTDIRIQSQIDKMPELKKQFG